MRSNRLAGHTLPNEGRVIRSFADDDLGPVAASIACSCGEHSPRLPSDSARKAWHRDHKNDVRSAAGLAKLAARAVETQKGNTE